MISVYDQHLRLALQSGFISGRNIIFVKGRGRVSNAAANTQRTDASAQQRPLHSALALRRTTCPRNRRACALPPRPAYVRRLGAAMAAGRGRASAPPHQGGAVSAGPAPEGRRVPGAQRATPNAPVRTRLLSSGRSLAPRRRVSTGPGLGCVPLGRAVSAPRALRLALGTDPPLPGALIGRTEPLGRRPPGPGATTTKGGGRPAAAATASPGASFRSRVPVPASPAPDEV